jgi:hypothetical protein
MTTATTLPTAIPWYKSPQTIGLITTFVAAAIALFPKAGVLLGLTSPNEIQTAVSNAAGVVAVIAPFIGTIVRAKSTVQPITLTQAQADNHPVTLAAQAAPLPLPPETQHPPGTIYSEPVHPVTGKPWGKI